MRNQACTWVGLLVHRQTRIPLHLLPVGEAERFGGIAEPAARWLPALRGVPEVPGRRLLAHPGQVILKIKSRSRVITVTRLLPPTARTVIDYVTDLTVII